MKRTKSYQQNNSILYLVATPIGNLNEISTRTVDILKCVDLIACEDTRTSGILLKHLDINTKTISYHNYNEEEITPRIINLLNEGKNIVLISDAGYPLMSDPGFTLVRECRKQGIAVSTISGPNAAINALVASGLETVHYLFYGFLNSKASKAKSELAELKDFPYTMVFYEAPHRINKTLELMEEVLGDRRCVLARELTKIHEEYIEGTFKEIKELTDLKGEMVIVVEGNKQEKEEISEEELFKEIDELSLSLKNKDAIKEVANKYKLSKNDLYSKYLKYKEK